jgi:hypothetical protein
LIKGLSRSEDECGEGRQLRQQHRLERFGFLDGDGPLEFETADLRASFEQELERAARNGVTDPLVVPEAQDDSFDRLGEVSEGVDGRLELLAVRGDAYAGLLFISTRSIAFFLLLNARVVDKGDGDGAVESSSAEGEEAL